MTCRPTPQTTVTLRGAGTTAYGTQRYTVSVNGQELPVPVPPVVARKLLRAGGYGRFIDSLLSEIDNGPSTIEFTVWAEVIPVPAPRTATTEPTGGSQT